MSQTSQTQPAGAVVPPHGGQKIYWTGAAIALLFSLVLYVRTMAGSASFWDSGEFIAAAYRLGIPHSPGTPLYVLLGRVFSVLPLPFIIAQRVNLISAVCGAVGVLFVYMLIIRFLDQMFGKSESAGDTFLKVAGALTGALFLTFSDTYWTNATEAEVYAMSNALMGFMTWLTLKWGDRPGDARSTFLIYLTFYLLALSVGFHLGTILVFSGIFFYVLMTPKKRFSNVDFLIGCIGVAIFVADATLYRNGALTVVLLIAYAVVAFVAYGMKRPFALVVSGLFLLGLSVHLYLLIRSGHNPTIDEGNPETWRNLYAVLRREQYPPTNVFLRKASFIFQLKHFNGYFQAQYQMAAAYVGQMNMGALLPIGLGIWGIVDQFSKNRKAFVMLFVTLVIMSLGLIIFLNFSDSEVRERDYFYSPAFYYFAIYIGIGVTSLLSEIRSAFSHRAQGARLSPVVAVIAVVFMLLPMFTLKHHYFTHNRSHNYVCPIYARNMLVGLEKDAIIFTNGDNDTFPLWYIQDVEGYRTDVRVVNLSLLNTPWYIEQCRDNEPKVPISWSNDQIERLRPVPTKDGWLLVRDLAVQHILQTNRFRRPVYFAVTIPPSTYAPYRRYMEMEGLVYKVVPREGDNMVNVTRLEKNVWENIDYTCILDKDWNRDHSLYLPDYTEHLIQNYAAAFIQLAYIQHQDSTFAKALKSMKAAYEISPHMEPPRQLLGLYYLDAGDTAQAIEYYHKKLREDPGDVQLMYRFAGVYERMGQNAKALDLLDSILAADPENRDIYITAFQIARAGGMVTRGRSYLQRWLSVHPNDDSVRRMMGELDRPRAPTKEGQ